MSRSTLQRYLTNQRIPQPLILQKIIELTGGQVQLADFLDGTPPKCAKVIKRPDGTVRWVFSWSNAVPEQSEMYSSRLSPSLVKAIAVLNGRAWYTPKGRFLLDGRISDPKRIVSAANIILREKDQPIINYPIVESIE
ncbi:hypothetical protein COB72_01155 [bacterium]|nr:MAG: hypothetical protein COB72_01155 [bacterium]